MDGYECGFISIAKTSKRNISATLFDLSDHAIVKFRVYTHSTHTCIAFIRNFTEISLKFPTEILKKVTIAYAYYTLGAGSGAGSGSGSGSGGAAGSLDDARKRSTSGQSVRGNELPWVRVMGYGLWVRMTGYGLGLGEG